MTLPLSQLRAGRKGIIEKILSDSSSTNQLSAMGLLPGRLLEVLRFAPLGDPIAILVDGQHLSLRKSDAEAILIRAE